MFPVFLLLKGIALLAGAGAVVAVASSSGSSPREDRDLEGGADREFERAQHEAHANGDHRQCYHD